MKKQQMMMSKDDYSHDKCNEFMDKIFKKYLSFENVMVTGGSGFLGRRLQLEKPEWNYISSKDCNLTDFNDVRAFIHDIKPDAIVHLAGRVGGIKDNSERQAEFYLENTLMNTNLIHAAHLAGVDRVLSSLSTCAFPDTVENYPFTEEHIFDGPPAVTNFSYGYTKRTLHVQSVSYRNQYNRNYSTFAPSNIYGPGDHFNSDKSHFVPALISKLTSAKDNTEIELWGTGFPLRQQLYVDDLVKIIPMLLEKHNNDVPIIVAPNENLSIKQMADIALTKFKKNVNIRYNNKLDGQYRKDGSNQKLINLIGEFEFTSFNQGIENTINWYMENN
jgi:GDP-L-fucose synthase